MGDPVRTWLYTHLVESDEDVKIDKFLKVESLAEDFAAMNTLIGVRPVALPNWKANKGRVDQYHRLYSPQEARIVGDLYANDVRIGGYACPEQMIDPNKPFRRKPPLYFKLRSAIYSLGKKLCVLPARVRSWRS